MEPKLPERYFGNGAITTYATIDTNTLLNSDQTPECIVIKGAEIVRKSVDCMNSDSISNWLGYLQNLDFAQNLKSPVTDSLLSDSTILVSNWTRFDLNLDFGVKDSLIRMEQSPHVLRGLEGFTTITKGIHGGYDLAIGVRVGDEMELKETFQELNLI